MPARIEFSSNSLLLAALHSGKSHWTRWAGPVKSVYGLHLVLVKERQNRRLPDLKEIRETVKRDWLVEKQTELKDAAYAKIRERYTVTVEKPKSDAALFTATATTKVKTQ